MSVDELTMTLKRAIELHKAGQIPEAEALYRQVLEKAPHAASALQNLGLILNGAGQKDEAIALLKRSVEAEPGVALFHRNLAAMYRGADRHLEAVEAVKKAVALTPEDGLCWADLGVSLDRYGSTYEALACYERAIRLLTPVAPKYEPGDPPPSDGTPTTELSRAHYNAGTIWGRWKNTDAALAEYDNSIRVLPTFAEAHRNRSAILFLRGKMAEAWREYEWRWKCPDYPGTFPKFKQPVWDGSSIAGKTILLWWEQGFGDTLQFSRYAPLLTARGARVALMVQKELKRLFWTLDGVAELVFNGERKVEFDTHISVLSVPAVMKTDLHSIPTWPAYLRPDEADVIAWKKRLDADGPGPRVGLVWAGARAHKNDKERSITLDTLAPILAIPNIRFYSMQMGDSGKDLAQLPTGKVIDHTALISDFADSAALLECLDLLITVDTAPAHLAGAIGKPVWTLLQFEPDFRWLADTENPSRWYPSMRHFRQTKLGDWKSVMERVAGELRHRFSASLPS